MKSVSAEIVFRWELLSSLCLFVSVSKFNFKIWAWNVLTQLAHQNQAKKEKLKFKIQISFSSTIFTLKLFWLWFNFFSVFSRHHHLIKSQIFCTNKKAWNKISSSHFLINVSVEFVLWSLLLHFVPIRKEKQRKYLAFVWCKWFMFSNENLQIMVHKMFE